MSDRSLSIVHANYLVVSNPSSFGRKIEKSFTTFVGGGCEALRDKRAASKTGGESDNLQPDEGGHSLEVKHRSRPSCEM